MNGYMLIHVVSDCFASGVFLYKNISCVICIRFDYMLWCDL